MQTDALSLPTDAPERLMRATKVIGLPVFDDAGKRIGHIEDVALEKLSGKPAYAIASFGGFLGLGEKYHPLPWAKLLYDSAKEGYVVQLSHEQLRDAPAYSKDELDDIGPEKLSHRWVLI